MNRAVIFAHYDVDGVVDPYVIEAVTAYRRLADVLVFVSASASSLPPGMPPVVDRFISRGNVGYDFGSWKSGWEALRDRGSFDEIVFVNDSVYGPLFEVEWAGDGAACARADYWGMVMSEARSPHVQSWFAVARRPVIRSPGFADFWDGVGTDMPKEKIIDRQEVGLSARLLDGGFTLAGAYDGRTTPLLTSGERRRHLALSQPLRSLRFLRKTSRRRRPFDPSLLTYERLWKAGVPFIKRRLLEVNPYALDLGTVRADLRRLSPKWHALIERHQARLRAHRSLR